MAVQAKRILGKKLVTRCGFMLSLNWLERDGGQETAAVLLAKHWENKAFTAADQVVVTTPPMKKYVAEQYGVTNSKISVIPNYVLTDIFKPNRRQIRNKKRICFIGRLEVVKDPILFLESIKGLDLEVDIIGDGQLRSEVEKKATQYGLPVRFLNTIANNELPNYLNSAAAVVFTSKYEGHRKAILESMSCGLPVIGVNVRGIQDTIQHKTTGYLCDRSPEGIRDAVSNVLKDDHLRNQLSRNSREFIVQNFDIDKIVELELELLHSLSINN